MKKSIFLLSALSAFALTFSSCSSDDEAVQSVQGAKAGITFAANLTPSKATRATAITADNFLAQLNSFKVWGYLAKDATYYLGSEGEGGIYIDGDGQGNWSYRNSNDKAFWAGETPLNFYAVTPADNENFVYSNGKLTYTIPADQSKQVDLMVAKANDQKLSTNNGTVALEFQHMLSQVSFAAKTKNDLTEVEIKSITIHNVNNSFATALRGDAPFGGFTYDNYSVGLASPVTTDGTTAVSATDANGVLMLAPQTISGWADGTTTEAADQSNQGYLEIECKIKVADSYLVGSETEYGKTYVAFPATWEAGKKYVYTLVFGGGKKADGTDQLTPITFSVSVADWGETTQSDVNL